MLGLPAFAGFESLESIWTRAILAAEIIREDKRGGEASAGQVEFAEPGVDDAAEVQCFGLSPGVRACCLGPTIPRP